MPIRGDRLGGMPVRRQTWKSALRELIEREWRVDEDFLATDLYRHEKHFRALYPDNHNIKDKLREMMQHLRRDGVVAFIDDNGTYRRRK